MIVEDAQLARFAPRLDAEFRARCIAALRSRGGWTEARVERGVDIALKRARELGLGEERSVLAYLILAVDVVAARPEEQLTRSVEAILREPRLPEWQRVRLAEDYFRQMHRPAE